MNFFKNMSVYKNQLMAHRTLCNSKLLLFLYLTLLMLS